MQITNFHSHIRQSTSEEFQLFSNIIPNEILDIIFDQIVNQQRQPLVDISSILLTCKRWEGILKANPCISLLQTLFQITHSDRFTTITPPQECIATNQSQKKDFTSKELKLIDPACREITAFEKLLMMDSALFHPKSLFLSLLDRHSWNPEVCKNSANQRIKMIAENQLSILNSLLSGSDEEKLTVIQNDLIEKFYSGAHHQRLHDIHTSIISTLKKFLNLNDKKKFIQVARCFGASIFDIHESLKKDREIVLAAVKQEGLALKLVDETLKKDREIVLIAVQQNGWALQYADETLKKDREIVLVAVQQNGWALKYADETLKKDREIVLAAVQQDGWALEYADESLKKDREIVLAAVQQDGYALQYADKSLKKDREIALAAIKQTGIALRYADESLKKDREIVLAAVQQDGWALEYADESLKKDREIVLAAVHQNGYALQYVDETLKKDRAIVLAAVKQFGLALAFADEGFKKDLQIVLAAVKQNVDTLPYAHETIQEIVLAAIQENG